MRLPARRRPRGASDAAIVYVVLIIGTVVMAVSIVVITRSTDGFAAMVEVLTTLAMLDYARRERREDK